MMKKKRNREKEIVLEGDEMRRVRTEVRRFFRSLPLFLCICSLLVVSGCGNEPVTKKELLIYCGITMIKPMSDIAKIIEDKYDCKIHITKGGSGNLLKSIKANQVGDLYLPGSDSYIKNADSDGLIIDSIHVGYNKAAMMTVKGNPRNIPSQLESLANNQYYVVIGNPESGSIGRETKKILEKKGNFEKVLANTKMLTTDSKDLVRVLREKEADLVINWFATSTWPENRDTVTVLPIHDNFASKKKLVIGLLSYSKYPEIAKEFMAYAAGEKGRIIFDQYGLYNVQ